MKKIYKIILNCGIVLTFALLVYFFVLQASGLDKGIYGLKYFNELLQRKINNPESVANSIESIHNEISYCQNRIATNSMLIFAEILSLSACVFLFVYCNPRLFRLSTWTNLSEEWAKNKQERAAARSAKAETDKKKRIAALQSEIDALKKDDMPPPE